MRKLITVCLLLVCAGASAASPLATTLTAITVPPLADAPRYPLSAQLQTSEIAVLLEHLQSQHVYLKHLENVRRAIEKELSIVRLMSECDRFGSACTGRGIAAKPVPPPAEPGSVLEEPEPPPVSPAELAPPAPPAPVSELPVVAGIYRKAASLIYRGRYVEVHEGGKVGPFTVTAVTLDQVELNGPGGAVALSAQRPVSPPVFAPVFVPGQPEF